MIMANSRKLSMLSNVACGEAERNKASSSAAQGDDGREEDRIFPPAKWVLSSSSVASASQPPPLGNRPYKKMKPTDSQARLSGWLEIVARMGGSVPVNFGAKRLTATDIGSSANRFLFTRKTQMLFKEELEKEEMRKLESDGGLEVKVLDRAGRKFQLVLKVWGSTKWIVLRGKEYMKFVRANRLQPKVNLTVWVFRLDHGPQQPLSFALIDDVQ